MMGYTAVNIVPEVISVEVTGIVNLHHPHAVLSLVVVRLPISPVEPLDSLILVGPEPLSRSVLIVPLSSVSSHPEVSPIPGLKHIEQLGLEPVVDTRMV